MITVQKITNLYGIRRYKVRLADGTVKYTWAKSLIAARAKILSRGYKVSRVSEAPSEIEQIPI